MKFIAAISNAASNTFTFDFLKNLNAEIKDFVEDFLSINKIASL